jgi:hypothetical protein
MKPPFDNPRSATADLPYKDEVLAIITDRSLTRYTFMHKNNVRSPLGFNSVVKQLKSAYMITHVTEITDWKD